MLEQTFCRHCAAFPFFLQKERIFPGVHKIGAPISGPRIADKHFTDTKRIFLNRCASKPAKKREVLGNQLFMGTIALPCVNYCVAFCELLRLFPHEDFSEIRELKLRSRLPCTDPISGLGPGMGKKWPKNGFWPHRKKTLSPPYLRGWAVQNPLFYSAF